MIGGENRYVPVKYFLISINSLVCSIVFLCFTNSNPTDMYLQYICFVVHLFTVQYILQNDNINVLLII